MPSPFPGMDPYLEGSEWTSVHHELSSEIARQLAPKLRPKYIVRPIRRFVMDITDEIAIMTTKRDTYPDVATYTTKEPTTTYREKATTIVPPPLRIATVTGIPEKVPVISIEIRDVINRELITAIEIISPTNKRGAGYEEYIGKRHRILNSFTHLLEIDLLRQGRRVPMQQSLPDAPYFIFLSRAQQRPITEVWPIQLDMCLPVVPVPLLPIDDDVALDLQLALDTAYDAFGYDLSVDYTRPPEIPLEGETAVWATELLQNAGYLIDAK